MVFANVNGNGRGEKHNGGLFNPDRYPKALDAWESINRGAASPTGDSCRGRLHQMALTKLQREHHRNWSGLQDRSLDFYVDAASILVVQYNAKQAAMNR